MENQKSGWGGKRPGAGRRGSGKVYKTVSISGTEEELNNLKEQARAQGKTVSGLILDALVPKDCRFVPRN